MTDSRLVFFGVLFCAIPTPSSDPQSGACCRIPRLPRFTVRVCVCVAGKPESDVFCPHQRPPESNENEELFCALCWEGCSFLRASLWRHHPSRLNRA